MPTLHPVTPMVTPQRKVSFAAKGMQWDQDAVTALKRFEKGGGEAQKGGGGAKKVVGLAALLAIVGGIALRKVPADKLPAALKPLQNVANNVAKKLAELIGKFKGKAADVADDLPKMLPPAAK